MEWKSFAVKQLFKIDKMYSLFIREAEQGFNFKGETHNFWECVYVDAGEVCVTAGESVFEISSGEMVLHSPLELHNFFVRSKSARLYIFSFSVEGEFEENLGRVYTLRSSEKNILQRLFEFTDSNCVKYDDLKDIRGFNHRLKLFEKSPIYSHTVYTYLTELFLSLMQIKTSKRVSDSPEAKLFNVAVDYMNAHIQENLSVEEIAKHIGISVSGLKRVFNKYADMGVHKYFLAIKIKAATQLLQSGESVCAVAERLGFSSQGYFSATYSREMGINPSKVNRL